MNNVNSFTVHATNITLYRSLVGALQYLTITRHDLAHSANFVSQYLHAPNVEHFEVVKGIMRYVKGTLHYGLSLLLTLMLIGLDLLTLGTPLPVTPSISVTTLSPRVQKKQPTVSNSSCEFEYRALASIVVDVLWLDHLLRDLHVPCPHRPLLLCHIKSVIF